uniref:Uncharacterized protein n=1 Tax=viral metagenome TaxID=1070528 RepID=A0A6C0D8K1_9ZZZZ
MDNMHILIGILLIVILYLVFNKKENYDDVPQIESSSVQPLQQSQPYVLIPNDAQQNRAAYLRDNINGVNNEISNLTNQILSENDTNKKILMLNQIQKLNNTSNTMQEELLEINKSISNNLTMNLTTKIISETN